MKATENAFHAAADSFWFHVEHDAARAFDAARTAAAIACDLCEAAEPGSREVRRWLRNAQMWCETVARARKVLTDG